MIIGTKEETTEQQRVRHIKEASEEKIGWERKLHYALEKNDTEFAAYCKKCIGIEEYILKQLEV